MRHLILSFILIFVITCATADTHFWDGSFSSNYTDAANWTNNTVPDSNDDIVVDGDDLVPGGFNLVINISRTLDDITIRDGGIMTVAAGASITSSGGDGILSMSNGGELYITGGYIMFTGDASVDDSTIEITGGELETDDLRVYGNSTLDVTGGTLDVDRMELRDDSVSDLSGGTITLDGWLWTDENAQLTIATTFTGTPNDGNDDDDFWIWGGSSVTVEDGAVISGWTNLDFEDTSGGNADPASLTINGGSFDITGDINASASDGDTITINDGSLNVDGVFNIGNSDIVIDSNGGVISIFDIVDTTGNDTSNFTPPIEGSVISGGTELPIELISFDARYVNNQVEISWVTGSEINNEYIVVQKSYDGLEFQTISRHQGYGTTSDIQKYSFTDTRGLNAPMIFYRLQQFDYDGKSETFPTEVVYTQLHSLQMTVNIFPNPTVSHVKVNISGMLKNEITEISIIDINGRMVKSESFNAINHSYELSELDHLNSGVYFLLLTNGDLVIKERLVIK
ncbi:MAG: hypothetical protein ACJA08_000750 [Cyclobacteriaceae bacterium]|jgi:hypothetical protein